MNAGTRSGWTICVCLVSLLLLGLALPATMTTANQPDDNRISYDLYAVTDHGRGYQPLDPLTLGDIEGAGPVTFNTDWPGVAISADGSTAVMIDPSHVPLEEWISVRDGLDGPERLAIDVEEAVYNPRLSADGSRVIAWSSDYGCSPYGCGERVFYTYDTRTGELISTVRVDLNYYVWPDMIDPAGERLYIPFYEAPPPPSYPATPTPPGISETGPWPLQIAVYDLTTGKEIERITVPNVLAGTWRDITITHSYASQVVRPAISLSPDGATIAVVDAPMETLTLIDTGTLEVVATHAIHERESTTGRLLDWLGITPRIAAAKVSEGRSLTASFSVDGRHLYLTGTEMAVGETVEEFTGVGLGVTMIDMATGEIVRTALEDQVVNGVIPSPDGRWMYVLSPETPWWEEADGEVAGELLRRLDAGTLELLAERGFDVWPFIQLVLYP